MQSIIFKKTQCLIWDGWMTCDFTSLSTIYKSNQDNGKMIMKGCVQNGIQFTCLVEKILSQVGSSPGLLDQ